MLQSKYMSKVHLSLFPLAAFPVMGLASYAYVGSFTRMLADDFCSIYFAERLGLFRSVWYWYLNWSGRYTAFAADWLILRSTLGPYRLHYLVPATVLLWLIFVTFAIHLHLQRKHEFAFLHALALAGTFLFVVLVLTPDIPQSLFWWNGMRSYALPLVVLSLFILLFQLYKWRPGINPALGYGLAFILFFLSGGMGETMAVAQTAFILFMIGLHFLKLLNRPGAELIALYYSLAGAVCSLVVVILSPGNAIRQALLPPHPDIAALASISIRAYGTFIADLFREPAGISGLAGAILAAIWIGGHYRDSITVRTRLVPASILGGVLISFACFPPGVFGYSAPPPARILIIPVFFLVAGVLCAGFIMGCRLADRPGLRWLGSTPLIVSIALLMAFSSMTTARHLYAERHIYIEFAEKWDRVDAHILQARADNLESVNIPAMDNWAGLERPTDNEKYWPTLCYSNHYGIQVVGPPYSE
jgi:hypothetical protein